MEKQNIFFLILFIFSTTALVISIINMIEHRSDHKTIPGDLVVKGHFTNSSFVNLRLNSPGQKAEVIVQDENTAYLTFADLVPKVVDDQGQITENGKIFKSFDHSYMTVDLYDESTPDKKSKYWDCDLSYSFDELETDHIAGTNLRLINVDENNTLWAAYQSNQSVTYPKRNKHCGQDIHPKKISIPKNFHGYVKEATILLVVIRIDLNKDLPKGTKIMLDNVNITFHLTPA